MFTFVHMSKWNLQVMCEVQKKLCGLVHTIHLHDGSVSPVMGMPKEPSQLP